MSLATILQERGGATVSVPPDMLVSKVVELLTDNRIGAVPVIEDGQVIGIMSERDVIRALRRDGAGILGWAVERVMTRPVITVGSSISPLAGLSLMTQRRIRHLPVVDAGRLVGFVSIGDLVKARIDLIESESAAMRAYIAS
jgi:CBS domain-containing protein